MENEFGGEEDVFNIEPRKHIHKQTYRFPSYVIVHLLQKNVMYNKNSLKKQSLQNHSNKYYFKKVCCRPYVCIVKNS